MMDNDERSALDDAFAREEPNSPPPVEDPQHGEDAASQQDLQDSDDDNDLEADSQELEAQEEQASRRPRRTLVGDLQKAREKIKEYEAAQAEARKREADYLNYIQQIQQAQNQPQQQQVQPPDFYEDPEGYARHIQAQNQQQMLDMRVNMSEQMARQYHGHQAVDAAIRDARAAGVAEQFQHAQEPFTALLTWHKRVMALREIGDDPAAWKEQQRQSWQTELLQGFEQWKQDNGHAQPSNGGYRGPGKQRFPGTLASGTAAGRQGGHISEQAMMDDVFTNRR